MYGFIFVDTELQAKKEFYSLYEAIFELVFLSNSFKESSILKFASIDLMSDEQAKELISRYYNGEYDSPMIEYIRDKSFWYMTASGMNDVKIKYLEKGGVEVLFSTLSKDQNNILKLNENFIQAGWNCEMVKPFT